MKLDEIVTALRCISTVSDKEQHCEGCPFYKTEKLDAKWAEIFGTDEDTICDCDAVGLAAADALEKLLDRCARYAEEIAVLQERQRWIPVTERLPEAEAGDYALACVTWKNTRIDYQNAVVMAFVSEEGLVDVELDCVLEGVTHWMPLPEAPEVD